MFLRHTVSDMQTDVRRTAWLIALAAAMLVAVACGGGRSGAPTPNASAVLSATPGGAPAALTLDGEPFAVARTLPPSALSADKLEAAGTATGSDGARIEVARAETADVASWELVSTAADGWRVWRPRAVVDVLAAAGAGATLVSVTPMEWPDACMGLAQPGEACAQVVTPGYIVVIERGGQRTTYHVSRISGAGRLAP